MATHAPSSPAKPFVIGLKPLPDDDFLIVDEDLPSYLHEKRELYARSFDEVFMAKESTLDAQRTVLGTILDCLRKHHGQQFRITDTDVRLAKDNSLLCAPDEWSQTPLAGAALCVQDDLVLMQNSPQGWHLAAASLCFPSSWNLAQKFGKPMREIHHPVPLSPIMANRIDRIFDNLKPGTPVWRANWSLESDGELRQERPEKLRGENYDKLSGEIWFRSEYQTLHKLADFNHILFTIRIATGTLDEFLQEADGRAKMAALASQYAAMSHEELAYKGIQQGAERLRFWFERNAR